MQIIYKIKQLREERNLTQEELAEKSGVSRSLIAGLECGFLKETTTTTLKKLANALDVDIPDIFFNK